MRKIYTLLILLFYISHAYAQSSSLDVLHYHFDIALSDASDTLKGTATLRLVQKTPAPIVLDLHSVAPNGKGMQVSYVAVNDEAVSAGTFTHIKERLTIPVNKGKAGDTLQIKIRYTGIPADGLIISKNKWGDRTFFSDHWPNRAHHWLPCNDRPDDKATVEFAVTAPVQYQVISNGTQIEETNIDKAFKRTHWKEHVAIPTKVMAIGAAPMAVSMLDTAVGVPVSAWVYPQDRDKGFYDYALTAEMLRFFSAYVGPYHFSKLANVQSKTIFGGMENASAIFYDEASVTGNREKEDLMAHEVAHQWFGNAATEKSFAHVWLSEGFASYLTHIFLEHKYGRQKLQEGLHKDREEIIDFAHSNNTSIVNETSNLMSLLNTNSYQKGSWVLHMLRNEVGDGLFQKILRAYYAQYKGSNADTKDFQAVAENMSGKNLQQFFTQWLYQPGVPAIDVNWRHNNGKISIQVQQTGETLYQFPLEIALIDQHGKNTIHRLQITKIKESYTLAMPAKPALVVLDPDVKLLFSGTVKTF